MKDMNTTPPNPPPKHHSHEQMTKNKLDEPLLYSASLIAGDQLVKASCFILCYTVFLTPL